MIGIGIPRQNEGQLLLDEDRLGAGVHYSVVVVIRSQYQIVSIHQTSSRKAEENGILIQKYELLVELIHLTLRCPSRSSSTW